MDMILDLLTDSALVGWIAIAIASWSLYRSRRVQELQERHLQGEISRQQAEAERAAGPFLELRIEARAKASDYIAIYNRGGAEALNVRLAFLDQESPLLEEGKLIERIEPGSVYRLVAAFSKERHPPFKVRIRWDDRDGRHGSRDVTLTE